jgi:hypothetical protein
MSKKFCPLGFFSFYVNKSEAQAGACHHCVEENCALWNEEYEECSLKVGLDAVSTLADSFGAGHRAPTVERRLEVEAPKLSIFDKLRRKTEGQKLPTIEGGASDATTTVVPLAAAPPPPPAAPITPPAPAPAPAPAPTAPPAPTSSSIVLSTLIPTNDELLKPPDVPLETLPIISITSKEN